MSWWTHQLIVFKADLPGFMLWFQWNSEPANLPLRFLIFWVILERFLSSSDFTWFVFAVCFAMFCFCFVLFICLLVFCLSLDHPPNFTLHFENQVLLLCTTVICGANVTSRPIWHTKTNRYGIRMSPCSILTKDFDTHRLVHQEKSL